MREDGRRKRERKERGERADERERENACRWCVGRERERRTDSVRWPPPFQAAHLFVNSSYVLVCSSVSLELCLLAKRDDSKTSYLSLVLLSVYSSLH